MSGLESLQLDTSGRDRQSASSRSSQDNRSSRGRGPGSQGRAMWTVYQDPPSNDENRHPTPMRIYVDPPRSQPLGNAPEVFFRNPDTAGRRDGRIPLGELAPGPQGAQRYPYLEVPHRGWIPSDNPQFPHGPAGRLRDEHIEPDRYPFWPDGSSRASRALSYPDQEAQRHRLPDPWRIPRDREIRDRRPSHRRTQQLWKQAESVPIFGGSIEEYARWAHIFYEFVHVQPLGIAFKFAALQNSLSPHVRDRIMTGLVDVSDKLRNSF